MLQDKNLTYTGLHKLDFEVDRFLTVINEKGELVKTINIKKYDDIRFRIREENQVIQLTEQETQQLKAFRAGGTKLQTGCTRCDGKTSFKELEEERRCSKCNHLFKELCICHEAGLFHSFCFACHQINMMRN